MTLPHEIAQAADRTILLDILRIVRDNLHEDNIGHERAVYLTGEQARTIKEAVEHFKEELSDDRPGSSAETTPGGEDGS